MRTPEKLIHQNAVAEGGRQEIEKKQARKRQKRDREKQSAVSFTVGMKPKLIDEGSACKEGKRDYSPLHTDSFKSFNRSF